MLDETIFSKYSKSAQHVTPGVGGQHSYTRWFGNICSTTYNRVEGTQKYMRGNMIRISKSKCVSAIMSRSMNK